MGATDRLAVLCRCLLLLHFLAACGDPRPLEYRLSGPTMGTSFSVAVAAVAPFDEEKLGQQIQAALEDVDRHMSTYRADSALAVFNSTASTEWVGVPRRLCTAVGDALQLGDASGGAFDITVGPLVNLWGFGPEESRREPPPEDAVDEARARSGRDKLHVDCERPAMRKDHAELKVDLSGYAKGLAADEISALLGASGISNYLVEIGGDLRTRGLNAANVAWRIAIEMPDPAGRRVEKIIHVSGLGVATSGDYRNYFEFRGRRYSHTIDPRSGRPVTHNLASVTVLGETAAYADAMATALLVLGPEAGPEFAERENIAAYFLVRNGSGLIETTSSEFARLTAN